MSDVTAPKEVVHPPAISLREIWPWSLLALALLGLLYLAGAEGNVLHEYMHDGRHLLAFPCH